MNPAIQLVPVGPITWILPSEKLTPAPGWQAPQVWGMFAGFTVDCGSELFRMLCDPWQLAQLATDTSPMDVPMPW
jgi:hypothetical protein